MVARIRTGKSIGNVIFYNEQKAGNKKAVLLGDNNFIVDASLLTPVQKTSFFKKFTSLNQQTTVNALHVSLSFHPSENLEDLKLLAIAHDYMKRIGFAEQPYLVYKHVDTAHPHIHIVSTNVKKDGSRISLHNLGKNQSEKARVAIEQQYVLKKAMDGIGKDQPLTMPVSAIKVQYGKQATKLAISNVLTYVLSSYKFCSLPELNAVLSLYNVVAERGNKGSIVYEKGGLLYFATDDKGKKISAPLKASRFNMKPTLKNLELLFIRNESLRLPFKKQLTAAIDFALQKNSKGLLQLIADLKKERVTLIPRINQQNIVYGLTYIDHRSRCVFNGSDLGKTWSAKSICETFRRVGADPEISTADKRKESLYRRAPDIQEKSFSTQDIRLEIPAILPDAEISKEPVPFQLKKKRKTKKRRQSKL